MREGTLDDDPSEGWTPSYEGNKPGDFWTSRLQRGPAGKKIGSVEELFAIAREYFDWCHSNPLEEEKAFFYKGEVSKDSVHKMRAFTVQGFCIFAGISTETYRNYRKSPDLKEAVEVIDSIMYTQKFEGAAAGMLNPVIIARDLGLAEKTEVSGNEGGPIRMDWSKLSTTALEELDKALDEGA